MERKWRGWDDNGILEVVVELLLLPLLFLLDGVTFLRVRDDRSSPNILDGMLLLLGLLLTRVLLLFRFCRLPSAAFMIVVVVFSLLLAPLFEIVSQAAPVMSIVPRCLQVPAFFPPEHKMQSRERSGSC